MCDVGEMDTIGIDVEQMRPWSEHEGVDKEIEGDTLRDPEDLLGRWTRIEALAKAMGTGLPDDVRSLPVPTEPLPPNTWRRLKGWLWIEAPRPADCVAALVIRSDGADAIGTCDVLEYQIDQAGVRQWTIEVAT